ncbi:MAG: DUF4190 domain-containing protein [Clostridiales bacterium]|nr:DUF4190 domain-containing protein [Clostridiales bacterium]
MQKDGKTLSIVGLVLGIVSLVLFWCPYWNILGLVAGIVGIVLSVKGKKQATEAGVPTGMATAGLVLSIIGAALSLIGFFTCTLCVICATSAVNQYSNELNDLLSAYGSALN